MPIGGTNQGMNLGNLDAWINGRTLAKALDTTGARNRFGKVSPNCRIPLDLSQDSYLLGLEHHRGFPFVIEENLLATIHDFDLTEPSARFTAGDAVCALANLRFTRSALESAVHGFIDDTGSNETLRIERKAGTLDLGNPDGVFEFSRDVCAWGGGGRVWGNLMRFHSNESLGRSVAAWLRTAKEARDPSQAIIPGTQIKGLGVSFASKHLRLFDPERFATLDDVISVGLGYGLNPAGYNLWLHDLHKLKSQHGLPHRIGDLESGIFVLIRQIVRGTNLDENEGRVEVAEAMS